MARKTNLQMIEILKSEEYRSEYSDLLIKNEHIFWEIYNSCNRNFDIGCGSYLFDGLKYEYDVRTYEKQLLLFNEAKKVKSVLEIGTYMGHSLFIMLLANPTLNVTCIDIADTFAKPSIDILRKNFPESNIKFIRGNSLDALPLLSEKFDLCHIDGTHTFEISKIEFDFCVRMNNTKSLKIFLDDIDECDGIVNYIKSNFDIEEEIIPSCVHRNAYYKIIL